MYPLSIHRRIERQWADRIKSFTEIRARIAYATKRTLHRAFNGDYTLIPIKIKAAVLVTSAFPLIADDSQSGRQVERCQFRNRSILPRGYCANYETPRIKLGQ